MSPPAPPTELVPSERAVVLLSCALSALGSGLLVATHALWPDLRSRARRLLLFLSLADLLSAVSYFYGVLQDFEGPSWDCVLQGALSTFANTSSFFWTVAIALYLYLSIVRTSRGPGDGRLLWAFHVVSWGVPLVITVAAVALKKIGYDASDVSVGWCWVDLEAEDRVLWLLLTGKAWELLAYVTLPVLYLLIRKHIRRARLTPVLALATLIAAFGSSFQYGYNVAVINSPAKLMKAFYNETYYDRISEYISEFSLTLLWSVSVSMFPFGGFLGSLMVGPLVNKLGRKGTLLFNNIFSIVPAILMGCSEVARSFEMIIVARLLVGICAGLSSNVVPMYLGELAPKNLRGALGVVPQLFITVGILAAQILGLRSLLANEEGWPTLLGVTGVPAALQLLLLPFFPESPRYLLIQKRDEAAAKTALRGLRGWDDVDAETQEIREEDKAEKAAGFISVLKLLRRRSLRWQVISVVVLMGGQQLSGVNAIYYYADQIYLSAGVRAQDVQYVTAGTGAVNVLMTVCAVFVVELLGRRVLLLLGFSICFTACCVLTAALALQDTISWMPYVSIACIISYVIGHALGPSPIPALLITEIFLQSSRPAAYMVGGSVHWLSNFTVGLIFPFIQVGLGAYSFIVFAVICLLTTIYTFLVVPETKSKTFIEINQIFTKMNKVSEVHPEKEELKDFPPSTAGQ
ncbi:solute carrier family 2, facilitated glucose transporter member 5 isoform X9 [Physeter macrocephalus]|uniref:Solute carrier family 2, facilitated glucose transporter member 5 n=1 Tax=Physeter macrocephalus TaxID=9755 RepID=A0A455B518_PHYMC|nr:solute carrier family 2, facilitated glucose transporter member 5 isoform X9 [Physeter catodon]XP_028343680.1 solute carrier family 2, facilitated glucose transporter member 5 isoform X9 [Physeter catodon]|eukprot:XP_028343679.1 solute carrier family 2, facilitated glucose transporter member 5 isoform X7 [Physeter catodon]